jgi:hypothetical protein
LGFSKVFFIHLKLFFMKNFLLTAMLLGSTAVVGQIAGFKELKKNFFFKSVNTQSEAVATYNKVMDSLGCDTAKIGYTLDNNPLVFSSLKISDKKVITGFIIAENDSTYSVLFYYIKNETTYFFDVEDVDGEVYQMVYEPNKM